MTTAFEFQSFTSEKLNEKLSTRKGEKRLGETIEIHPTADTKFVILGICEDIGPQTNLGTEGARYGFDAFLSKFLNMQSNRFLTGNEIALLGTIIQKEEFTSIERGKELVEQLDHLVSTTLKPWIEKGMTPIVIGGGHNNAFPILKAFYEVHNTPMEVINLDPHADCRALEGRHSGNPFSYAIVNNFLSHYQVVGLHKAYNNEFIYTFLDESGSWYSFFEDYIVNPGLFTDNITSIASINSNAIGIEIDMDSIQFMPSSAITPSGFSIEQARQLILTMKTSSRKLNYLHLPEGIAETSYQKSILGKALAYLVHDFIQNDN